MTTDAINRLTDLLKEFYTVIDIRISIFDSEFHLVTEYPKTAPDFCNYVRRTEAGRRACARCDYEACMRAKALKGPHTYVCHAGLTEAITPIRLDGGVYGYAILAHILPQDHYAETVRTACEKTKKYGVSRAECLRALAEITPRSEEQIHASVKILDALASYLYIHNFIRWENDDIAEQIDGFIHENLHQKISSETLCNLFHCSRSSLYRLSLKHFDMSIGQYLTQCRIARAKELLLDGKSIAETAEMSGFEDYNYFCKIFKRETGLSPTKFIKQNQ